MKMKCFHYPQSFTLIIDVKFNFQCCVFLSTNENWLVNIGTGQIENSCS